MKEVKAGFEITGALVRQVFLNNRAQESTQANAELDKETVKPIDQQDQSA